LPGCPSTPGCGRERIRFVSTFNQLTFLAQIFAEELKNCSIRILQQIATQTFQLFKARFLNDLEVVGQKKENKVIANRQI